MPTVTEVRSEFDVKTVARYAACPPDQGAQHVRPGPPGSLREDQETDPLQARIFCTDRRIPEFRRADTPLTGINNSLLCERGITPLGGSFKPATRFTLDLTAVPLLRKETPFPVIANPSHGTGHRDLVLAHEQGGHRLRGARIDDRGPRSPGSSERCGPGSRPGGSGPADQRAAAKFIARSPGDFRVAARTVLIIAVIVVILVTGLAAGLVFLTSSSTTTSATNPSFTYTTSQPSTSFSASGTQSATYTSFTPRGNYSSSYLTYHRDPSTTDTIRTNPRTRRPELHRFLPHWTEQATANR